MTAKVIPFPKKQERMLVVMLYVPLGNLTEKEAQKKATKGFDEVLDCVEEIPDIAGTYWLADCVDVH